MSRRTYSRGFGPADFATRSEPIAPSDTAAIEPPKCILVGDAGVIMGRLENDAEDRSFAVPAGYNPLRFKLIKATGTTAGRLVALY